MAEGKIECKNFNRKKLRGISLVNFLKQNEFTQGKSNIFNDKQAFIFAFNSSNFVFIEEF